MTDESYQRKFAELDSLLNDPNMPLSPARIWELERDCLWLNRAGPVWRASSKMRRCPVRLALTFFPDRDSDAA
jgi:hypothetical protein